MTDQHPDRSPIASQMAAPPPKETTPPQASSTSALDQTVQSRAAVLGILFGVTGVLGLPLLWMNRSFSNRERILWSIVVTIYTALLIAIAAAIVVWSYRQIFR